ncbi:(deoxy)nucleoside triphosphate pyrophosphohydrolase [Sphingomonas sp. RP10(2022)]|uniref:8-oxo-dGTP diphosphatase n=1 Tax=Sphingomonas liriopis TaxID=2949094 RepID=A0A9X2KQ42_9SPHN|nr:(deoxy)nucleoside triphosphate pyrophosphohydrolase [Sphingomonas liriopis]MCP3735324.1 (deoxy)nucleoside triphosphate pyrophosphohydrolase [Sphingomonas liriopis]
MADDGAAPAAMPLRLMPVVAAALIDGEGRVLLQRRPPGKQMADLWEFPGGKIEPGETLEGALVRELAEELGIAVDAGALTPLTFASAGLGERHLLLLLYTIRDWRGTPRALEASALAWVRPAAMRALAMPPADLPLVAMLERLLQIGG